MTIKLPDFRLYKVRVVKDIKRPDRFYRKGEVVHWIIDRTNQFGENVLPLPEWLEEINELAEDPG